MKMNSFMMRFLSIVGLVALFVPAIAQPQEHPDTIRAYAAGHKAALTCSAVFNADKDLTQIAEHELTGIYPHLVEDMATLPDAVIDRENRIVTVAFKEGMPPRISAWRPHLGCAQLPVGATLDEVELLPRVDISSDSLMIDVDDGAPWITRAPINGSTGHAALDAVIAKAFEKPNYGRDQFTTAILIATADQILAEHYISGFTPTTSQRTWSVAKSIGASVIGVAVQQGILQVDAPANIGAWQRPLDPRGDITLENLLQMASGLDHDLAGNRTDRLYLGGGLVSDTATRNALEVTPGTRWKYANNDTLLALRSFRESMDGLDAYLRFPFEELLYKIGMTHTQLETDWDGNFILSSQVWTTARDLARLGLLYLNDGVWEGAQILPEGWADYVATAAGPQPPERFPGYGAQWWLYNERFPEVPDDMYAARGNRGQNLAIIPSFGLIIVRRGYDPAGGQGFQLHEFVADVLVALNAPDEGEFHK